MKKQLIIRSSNDSVNLPEYGGCVAKALMNVFKVEASLLSAMFAMIGNYDSVFDGATFTEVDKVIKTLRKLYVSKGYHINPIYKANNSRISYYQAACVFTNGTYIMHFPEHISALIDGVVYDAYYTSQERYKTLYPKGWWRIR